MDRNELRLKLQEIRRALTDEKRNILSNHTDSELIFFGSKTGNTQNGRVLLKGVLIIKLRLTPIGLEEKIIGEFDHMWVDAVTIVTHDPESGDVCGIASTAAYERMDGSHSYGLTKVHPLLMHQTKLLFYIDRSKFQMNTTDRLALSEMLLTSICEILKTVKAYRSGNRKMDSLDTLAIYKINYDVLAIALEIAVTLLESCGGYIKNEARCLKRKKHKGFKTA